ncbi:MAG: M2 family metallopeptidase [Xanthomonadales bacterium]|nr:M2 family metallopeptidase [Gammaproteobacteria bacterium]NNK51458.1 M2 family metallopeptidase [Xanthomonadales bacterium]
MNILNRIVLPCACVLALTACEQQNDAAEPVAAALPAGPTAADAAAFVADAEQQLAELGQHNERVAWVLANFITEDTELLAARASEQFTAAQVAVASEAARFNDVEGLDYDTARKLNMLKSGIVIPAPMDPEKTSEQAEIGARLNGLYGRGSYCLEDGDCLALGQLEDIIGESRDPAELLEAWEGWRTVSPPMKDLYARQVELANEGAAELGFDDLGTMWRSAYDMDPAEFPGELDRLWEQVSPLYEALHCHVRAQLQEVYGSETVAAGEPIPAHLLGNMWAQSWDNIYDLVAPPQSDAGYDLTEILLDKEYNALKMVRTGEAFFSSLGFEPLPETFWSRSLFVKPADRDVVCHASAWDIDEQDDLRIKMCIDVNAEDFNTIHHELGHNYYQRAYKDKSYLYRSSANDGFHEAVGDTLSLSITPEYLAQLDLLEQVPDASGDLGLLMNQALGKIAFLPFGLMVDQWRWKVFAGEVGPEGYNDLWWQLREQYQGVRAPRERPADAFDPGAKYHVPGNTPYTRYFLAHILQFQFHRALCEIAGNEGPIHRCSIYNSEAAGERLNAMLEMGRSRPWPEALEALTGSPEMDATAILDYFAPLQGWLDEQNAGRQCGW